MRRLICLMLGLVLPVCGVVAEDGTGSEAAARAEREALVDGIAAGVKSWGGLLPKGFSRAVIQAMRDVPRHRFVPATQQSAAYQDRPLPIGEGQTISQPSLVALMTEMLEVGPGSRVLEVGTGSGYQAAILAALGCEVYSIEIVEPLGRAAAARLAALGYQVEVRIGDGYAGWPEAAPFDAIIVTAAAPHVPRPLLAQLKPGGRMVIPVDDGRYGQDLALIEKRADGSTQRRDLVGVLFVPLTGAR